HHVDLGVGDHRGSVPAHHGRVDRRVTLAGHVPHRHPPPPPPHPRPPPRPTPRGPPPRSPTGRPCSTSNLATPVPTAPHPSIPTLSPSTSPPIGPSIAAHLARPPGAAHAPAAWGCGQRPAPRPPVGYAPPPGNPGPGGGG